MLLLLAVSFGVFVRSGTGTTSLTGETLEFSKAKQSFRLVGVVVVRAVITFCNAVLKLI